MQSQPPQDELGGADRELESALSRLAPATPGIDARTLLLTAERARTARRIWAYRAVAAILALALLISLLARPKAAVRETVRTVFAPVPKSTTAIAVDPPAAPPAAMVEEFRYCQQLTDKGLAALPAALPAAPGAAHPDASLIDPNSLLN